jgi:cytochrome b pre-mRNA-processing protein 3
MVLNLWKAGAVRRARAEALYRIVMRQTRRPEFYAAGGIEDTFEGRFDLLVAHVAMVLFRLKEEGSAGGALAQTLFDLFFADMDAALRELGVGDTGVGKRIRQMSEAFYGRLEAYDTGLGENEADETLRRAVARNLYGRPGDPRAAAVAAYMRASVRFMRSISLAELERSPLFTAPPEFGDIGARPRETVQ